MNIRDSSDGSAYSHVDMTSDKERCVASIHELSGLRHGWNGYDADPIDPAIIGAATKLVQSLAEDRIGLPQVVPMTRGRLQLEWHRGSRSLEVEFETPNRLHYLKWDPDLGIEDENVVTANDQQMQILVNWFLGVGG